MSSINPVVLFPAALAARGDAIATGFVDSLTLGVGQFCTNPGLVLAIDGPDLDRFETVAAQALAKKPAGVMLTRGIADAYRNGRGKLAELPGVREIGAGEAAQTDCQAGGALYEVGAQAFLAEPAFSHEVFGPASLIVRCRDLDEVARVLEALEGQLTATLQMDADDKPLARRLLPILNARRAACWSTATRPASRCATRWCTAGRSRPRRTRPSRRSVRRRSSVSCGRCATRISRTICCRKGCRKAIRSRFRGCGTGRRSNRHVRLMAS